MVTKSLGNKPCGGRFENVLESIGNTPLVELPRLSPKPGVRIWAKLEGHNPTGSVKDRIAKAMIEGAEEEGSIEPGQTILEPTSGNTGIALGMVCRRKGYPLKVVIPDNVTEERIQLLRMYGAEIVTSEGAKGSNGAVELALEMAEGDSSYFMPYQYGNEANPRAHYEGTAPEILEELDQVSAFVGGLGTGGTLMGNGRRLKEENPETKIVAAEPMQGEDVSGLRSLDDGFIPPIIDMSILDRKIMVSNTDAIVWTKRLLEEEGLFAGVSSGAIAAVATRIAGELDEDGNVVFLVPDDGWKYLSSGVYTKPLEELEGIDSTFWW
jgi:cysteine synthase B